MFTSYNPCSFTELICVASSTLMVTQHFSCKAVFLAHCCHGIIFKHQDFALSTCQHMWVLYEASKIALCIQSVLCGSQALAVRIRAKRVRSGVWDIFEHGRYVGHNLVHDWGMLGRERTHRWTCVITRVKTVRTSCFPDNFTLLYHWIKTKEFLFCFRFLCSEV